MESNSFTFPLHCQAATLLLSHSSGSSLLSPQSVSCSDVVEGTPRVLMTSFVVIGDNPNILFERSSVFGFAPEMRLTQYGLTNELLVSIESLFLQ